MDAKNVKITEEQMMETSHLARLSFTKDEVQRYTNDLNSINHLFEQLDQADTSGIQDASNLEQTEKNLRIDEIMLEGLSSQASANEQKDVKDYIPFLNTKTDLIEVPKVFETPDS
jgi:aspartyl-tRNA(Asn)/glutamyl-tRNA(Gln) amidotransferase subunit C